MLFERRTVYRYYEVFRAAVIPSCIEKITWPCSNQKWTVSPFKQAVSTSFSSNYLPKDCWMLQYLITLSLLISFIIEAHFFFAGIECLKRLWCYVRPWVAKFTEKKILRVHQDFRHECFRYLPYIKTEPNNFSMVTSLSDDNATTQMFQTQLCI
jgi:hypothetical protein